MAFWWGVLFVAWVAIGLFSAGCIYGYVVAESADGDASSQGRDFALLVGIVLGPLSLPLALVMTMVGGHGWRLR